MIDDQDMCERENVSSGTGSPIEVQDKIQRGINGCECVTYLMLSPLTCQIVNSCHGHSWHYPTTKLAGEKSHNPLQWQCYVHAAKLT